MLAALDGLPPGLTLRADITGFGFRKWKDHTPGQSLGLIHHQKDSGQCVVPKRLGLSDPAHWGVTGAPLCIHWEAE